MCFELGLLVATLEEKNLILRWIFEVNFEVDFKRFPFSMTRKCKAREEEKTHWCKAGGGGENPPVQSWGGGEDPQGSRAWRWPLWRVGRGWDRLGRGQWEWPRRWAAGGRWFFARNL
jgi:hypothetical protein